MIQLYFISLIYLLGVSCFFLQSKYRSFLSFMLRFVSWVKENNKRGVVFISAGYVLAFLLLLLPSSPGPILFGDLLPASLIFLDSVYFTIKFSLFISGKESDKLDIDKEKGKLIIGYVNLFVALIHFLLPFFVIL